MIKIVKYGGRGRLCNIRSPSAESESDVEAGDQRWYEARLRRRTKPPVQTMAKISDSCNTRCCAGRSHYSSGTQCLISLSSDVRVLRHGWICARLCCQNYNFPASFGERDNACLCSKLAGSATSTREKPLILTRAWVKRPLSAACRDFLCPFLNVSLSLVFPPIWLCDSFGLVWAEKQVLCCDMEGQIIALCMYVCM